MARRAPAPADDGAATGNLGGFGRYAGPATLILSSLADGSKHGYALTKDIAEFAHVRLAPGTLYEALTRLEGQGLIEALPAVDRRRRDGPAPAPRRPAARCRCRVAPVDDHLGSGVTVELTEDRAQRLLRWYPPVWRERYGEEFAELLAADLGHQPRSWRRTADVAVAGLVARLSSVGLGGGPMVRPQAALATVGAAIVGFVACGVSLWSQLLIGWRWSPPDGHAVTIGVLVMSVAVAYLSVLALLAAAPVLIAALRATRRGEGQRLIGAIVLIVVGAAVLMIGGHHVESGWPGATGHSWRFQQLVPGGLASFGWAETLGISAYWAHPSDLAALPTTELVWMVLSPTAAITTFIGAVRLVRRVALSPAALRHERRLATAAAAGMVPYLGAAAWWVISSYSGADDVFRAGSLDLVLIAGMAAALAVARTATRAIGGQSPVRT